MAFYRCSSGGSASGSRDWSEIGYSSEPQVIQDDYDYAVQIKNNWVTSPSCYEEFFEDKKLVFMPMVDTSSSTDFNGMFQSCTSLTTIPQLDTSSGTDFNSMFRSCTSLTTIPQLDTSSGTDFGYMFTTCTHLTTIPQLDMSNANDISNIFSVCIKLINLGGFINLGQAYLTTASANYSNYTLDLSYCEDLTHDSLMNVINNLYDIASAGVQTQELVLNSTNLEKLSADEIAIATNKGWAVS